MQIITTKSGEELSLALAMTISAFFAIAFYNVVETTVSIVSTFRKRGGLYFYSMMVACWSIPLYDLGFLLLFFGLIPQTTVSCIIVLLGWYGMVTGQSIVLYSRLHLVVRDARKIRWVLIMVIFNGVVFHGITSVCFLGQNLISKEKFQLPYSIIEKVQITVFSIQETIISTIYIWQTFKILRPSLEMRGRVARKAIRHLILVNILVIIMDITLLATEYANQYQIQITYKGALYSIKLKMEFHILNQLFSIVTGERDHSTSGGARSGRGRSVALGKFGKPHASVVHETSIGYHAEGIKGEPIELQEDWPHGDAIICTTEVRIESSSGSAMDDSRLAKSPGGDVRTQSRIAGLKDVEIRGRESTDGDSKVDIARKRSGTPTSSEVQFAREGY